jgi:hypothetical protein
MTEYKIYEHHEQAAQHYDEAGQTRRDHCAGHWV